MCGAIIGRTFLSTESLLKTLDAWQIVSPFDLYVGAYVLGIAIGLIWLLHKLIFYDETAGFIKSAETEETNWEHSSPKHLGRTCS